jgi:hypothetical protein
MPIIARGQVNSDFVVGKDEFGDLQINSAPVENFYYFFNRKDKRLIKHFILKEGPQVKYVCNVTLIKKGEKFTPRLAFSVRNKTGQISSVRSADLSEARELKASVSLEGCHENFWSLVSFLQSLREIEVPAGRFSLVSPRESAIVSGLRERGAASLMSIIKQLFASPGVSFSHEDVNQLLKRKEKLVEFERGLTERPTDEQWWQNFFERNKWIFGYGLNYQILRQEQAQPHYGGTQVSGRGGQKGDYLVSTVGDVRFTVLVEIKTPKTSLLQGSQEIRNGAWSLSKDLTDALSQMSANISTWNKRGSEQPENRDRLETKGVYTVEPKGIIVIGSLSEVEKERSKRETVQRFRTAIHGIDIITFDELYSRAKFIAEQKD